MDYSPEFREVLDFIYSFTMNGRKSKKQKGDPRPPSLDLMKELMEYFGQPQHDYPVVHIAGTKGKGSTANFIANTLIHAGYKVGLYTSPHLHDFSERIQINANLIPHTRVASIIERIKPFICEHPEINTFEIITAIGFLYFSEEEVDIAVIEVGLGGRFDATNVVNPLLSVITSISFDHMDLLGDTLGKIAFEKAGIIKPQVPVVIGKQFPEVHEVLFSIAKERNAPILEALKNQVKNITTTNHGHSFEVLNPEGISIELSLPLHGYHQIENAMIAYTAICHLNSNGYTISESAIKIGFSTVEWPARFEIVSMKPYIVVDGAHNKDSVVRVIETVRLVAPRMKLNLIFGVSVGKDVAGMLKVLLPESNRTIMSRSTHPKSMQPGALVQLAEDLGYLTQTANTVEDALEYMVKRLGDEDVLLCTGSLFIAAAVRDIWKTMKSETKE